MILSWQSGVRALEGFTIYIYICSVVLACTDYTVLLWICSHTHGLLFSSDVFVFIFYYTFQVQVFYVCFFFFFFLLFFVFFCFCIVLFLWWFTPQRNGQQLAFQWMLFFSWFISLVCTTRACTLFGHRNCKLVPHSKHYRLIDAFPSMKQWRLRIDCSVRAMRYWTSE